MSRSFDSDNRDVRAEEWAKRIKDLHRYTCDACGTKNGPFESHHKNAWNDYPYERYDLNAYYVIMLCIIYLV